MIQQSKNHIYIYMYYYIYWGVHKKHYIPAHFLIIDELKMQDKGEIRWIDWKLTEGSISSAFLDLVH